MNAFYNNFKYVTRHGHLAELDTQVANFDLLRLLLKQMPQTNWNRTNRRPFQLVALSLYATHNGKFWVRNEHKSTDENVVNIIACCSAEKNKHGYSLKAAKSNS